MGNIFFGSQQDGERRTQPLENEGMRQLLQKAETEFQTFLTRLRSMRDLPFNNRTIQQIYEITCDSEQRLNLFNWKIYQKYRRLPAYPPCPQPGHFRQIMFENVNLKQNVELLEKQKRHAEERLAHSTRQRTNEQTASQNLQRLVRNPHRSDDMVVEIRQQRLLITQLEGDLQNLQQDYNNLKAVENSYETHQTTLQAQIEEQKTRIADLSEQNENLLLRLSRSAGQKLTENNPAIANLSDPNRPTKLGEVYSEIYDNEWTDAFEELTMSGYSDDESIETLRLTLLNTLQFCQKKSETLLRNTEEAVNCLFDEFREAVEWSNFKHLTMTRKKSAPMSMRLREDRGSSALQEKFDIEKDNILLNRKWRPMESDSQPGQKLAMQPTVKAGNTKVVTNNLVAFRKEVAVSMVPLVQKAYMSASWSDDCLPALKPFIMKCLFLGWMMAVQTPPMVLMACDNGEEFNKNMFKEYTRSGQTVKFVVWPALLLHENGPVIGKGVAQGQ